MKIKKVKIGDFTLMFGCMFAGKTDALQTELQRRIIAKEHVMLFKPSVDVRYNANKVVSHSMHEMDAIVIDEADAFEIIRRLEPGTTVVGIDEVQFFHPDIVDVVKQLLAMGIEVICAGLKQDFRDEAFGSMEELFTISNFQVPVYAVCNVCGDKRATHTQRFIDGKLAKYDSPQIVVGGKEAYEARCTRDYKKPKKPKRIKS